jgi:hypothetical protein
MATKMSIRKEYLEYVTIRPTNGLSLEQIGTFILMWYKDDYDYDTHKVITTDNLGPFFKKRNTWNKIMSKVKDIMVEEGMAKLDYAFENIEAHDVQLAKVISQLKKYNTLIGTKK